MKHTPKRRRRIVRDPSAVENGEERTPRGTFAAGNKAAAGRAARNAEARAAIRDAVTPAELRHVLRALLARALKGCVHSASLLLDRVVGKPRPEESEARISLDLPPLTTLEACAKASAAVAAAATTGSLALTDARAALAIVAETRDSILAGQVEARVRQLEGSFALLRGGARR